MTKLSSAVEPLVSVVVTAFNHERYIGEAIDSVLVQSYPHREVIVVDDGSTDRTADVLRAFGGRIRCIRQRNAGVAGSRNRGIREAKGHLLAFLDGDDRWHIDKLSCQVDAYRRFPDSGLIACDARSFCNETVLRKHLLILEGMPGPDDHEPVVSRDCFERLVAGNIISTTSQVVIPRHVLDDVGFSDTAFSVSSDYDLYLRIAFKYRCTFVRQCLTDYRYLPTSASGPDDIRLFRWTADVIDVLRKQKKTLPPSVQPLLNATLREKTRSIARLAYYRGCDGNTKWAVRYLSNILLKSVDPVASVYLVALLMPAPLRTLMAPLVGDMVHGCE